MPEITIGLVAGRSPETKKALMLDITQAVMKHATCRRKLSSFRSSNLTRATR
jgi:phenylpyruvate tautomerase PptA (4-oxalocrotonate tautomerase family)